MIVLLSLWGDYEIAEREFEKKGNLMQPSKNIVVL